MSAGARSDAVEGWLGEVLRVRVSAPRERGKANAAVVDLLSRTIGLPKQAVVIVSGHASPHKVVEFENASREEVIARLPAREG